MIRILSLGVLAVCVGALASAPAVGGIVLTIDDYTKPAGNPSLIKTGKGTATLTQGGLPTANVIGGERETVLNVTKSKLGLDTKLSFLSGPGLMTVSNDTNNTSTVSQTYDGAGKAGLGGVDLTASHGSFFEFDVFASDLGVTGKITVKDTNGKTSTLTKSLPGTGELTFDFASFVGLADFTTVNSIKIEFTGPNSADYAVDFFGVGSPVPEPATIGLALTGAAVVGGLARRRTRRSAD